MPTIHRTRIVPHTQQQMYELVNDIESYPQFVPWCVSSEILHREEDEIRAMLVFSRGGMQKSFITMNRLQPHKMIEIRLINGPFKQLEGFWSFVELSDNKSRVVLDLDFEFSNRWLAMMFGPVFEQVAMRLVDSFTHRAQSVYTARQ